MQKLQDSVFTLVKTTNLSPAVFSFLQPTDDFGDKTPLGGILKDTKHGWLALGSKFCVVDLRTGMKVAARTFGATLSNNAVVTSVVELPTPLTEHSQQLIISLQCDDISIICVLNINGSQILRCIQTDVVVTKLAVCDSIPDGSFTCFDGVVMAGTKRGDIFAFDLNRASLIQALKDISQGYEHLIQNELNPTNLSFLPLDCLHRIEEQRELALENDHHLAVLLNENSFVEGQYIFRNPDGTIKMKAKRDHIRVTVLEYIPQTGSLAVGFNFGAFQIWNLMALGLEFTSQINVECLPVTHFGFQEPCDDPRAFCYLWVIFSVIDRYEEEEFPLAVMYSLTYQGKRMLSDSKCLYQDFSTATIRFQVELSTVNNVPHLGGKCICCHTYSIKSNLGDEGEDSMLNLCQLVWECWAEDTNSPMQYGMLLFDLDQWYKDQMPSTYRVESNAFLSSSSWCEMSGGSGSVALHARLDPSSVSPYSHATRLEEHFYPNSLQYNCICLNTSEVCVLSTIGIQRQIISSMEEQGPSVMMNPPQLYDACARCGLTPLYANTYSNVTQEDQRRYLLSVALEARLARFLKRCAHDWATGSHSGIGCTLPFLVDWCWKRAIELKENAKELTAPLFMSSALPDRNIVRCLEHCVQQLTQLTGLMDAILTKCCNLVVPDALSEMEERHKGISTVSLYFQVVQWFLRVGLLPERVDGYGVLPYPAIQLYEIYNKRRMKLNRLQQDSNTSDSNPHKSCPLLYIDQLMEHEFGGERIHQLWVKSGSDCGGLYPPPSLYALLRLYLLPDIAEEHKHSLVLYLLVDYSMIYDDVRYEVVIRRLMQFPTMFGLSNTAIKATQAFWHLDHRDFDFALDQLQCLTGNTLSEWQHNVVLSSLLAQKKTQAALQYLHVRKPAPIQNTKDGDYSRVNDHDKLEDWHSCCNLYLARGLVYEALDVVRMCVANAASFSDKTQVLNMFFKGCRNTGNLSKILSVTLSPLEEEVFVKYLENCNESQTSDILIMYYLQQARYLEAERYNTKLRHSKAKSKDALSTSVESLFDVADREGARDALVEVMCAALPSIANTVAHCAEKYTNFPDQRDGTHVGPKPMSVYVQAKSPKNTFTYKSSFIQDTIDNASETWMNKPKMRKGLKRMLNIEETPFICTPKLARSRSVFNDQHSESTPPKRAKLNLTGTPKTPRNTFKVSEKLSSQMEKLLDMPEIQSPVRVYERSETPHSILKSRANSRQDAASPGSRYMEDSDDEMEMETASNHTHYSDSTNKHLRFTIPTPTEVGATPTPSPPKADLKERERSASTERERDIDISTDSYVTTASHAMNESNPLESPPKKLATETIATHKKSYKDTVRARRSLSISANSSLSEDPNTSIESIADIPITLINPRYSRNRRSQSETKQTESTLRYTDDQKQDNRSYDDNIKDFFGQPERESSETRDTTLRFAGQRQHDGSHKMEDDTGAVKLEVPHTPRRRKGIRVGNESTPLRSGSVTPERQDSPITPLRSGRISRSRSKTPSPRSSPLAPILEQPRQEVESELHAERSTLSIPRSLRSRSRTPERLDKGVSESPRLEAITESPTKSSSTDSPPASPSRRSLRARSRSKTPERLDKGVSESPKLEAITESPTKSSNIDSPPASPSRRNLRGRSKTPERLEQLELIVGSPTKSGTDSPPASPRQRSLRGRSKTPERLEKGVIESPNLELIVESPTKSSDTDSPPASPSQRSFRSRSRTPELEINPEPVIIPSPRSLRSRSRTPELEINPEPVIIPSPRSLRGRSKTPEKLMSPRKDSVRTKKSLSRLVLEANTFAKTKATLEKLEAETASESSQSESNQRESAIECTPMKTLKQVPSLMDVTLSPIVNKSILQSSTDSDLYESVDKDSKNSSKPEMPTFAPLHTTYMEKSVLRSYQSSAGDSISVTEEIEMTEESRTDLVPLPAFTTIHEDFGKSVLHSYESSFASSSQSMQDENVSKEVSKSDKTIAFDPINTGFGSVLNSQESSLADSRDNPMNDSSLITDDSDVQMSEENQEAKDKQTMAEEKQERAEQKEKETIVEIEREIHEIEGGNLSGDESSVSSESTVDTEELTHSSDEGAVITDSDGNESTSNSSSSNSSSEKSSSKDSDVIMIDSDTGDSRPTPSIKQRESKSDLTKRNDPYQTFNVDVSNIPLPPTGKEIDDLPKISSGHSTPLPSDDAIQSDVEKKKDTTETSIEVITNPMDEAQSSIMTDDNSVTKPDEMEVSEQATTTNPLDLAQVSLMTEESTVDEMEVTEPIDNTSRHKHDEKIEEKKSRSEDTERSGNINEGAKICETPRQTNVEKTRQVDEKISMQPDDVQSQHEESKQTEIKSCAEKIENPDDPKQQVLQAVTDRTTVSKIEVEANTDLKQVQAEDPLAQVSLMTEDNSELSDQELSLNYSVENIETAAQTQVDKEKEVETEGVVEHISEPEAMAIDETVKPKGIDVVDTSASETEREPTEAPTVTEETQFKQDTNIENMDAEAQTTQDKRDVNLKKIEADSQLQTSEQSTPKTVRSRKRIKSTSSNTEIEQKDAEPKTPATRKRTTSKSSDNTESESRKEKYEGENPKEMETKTISRKRTTSKSSTKATEPEVEKSDINDDVPEPEEPKTPAPRKRTIKSTARPAETSKEVEQDTDESSTPVTLKRPQSTEETTPENLTPRRTKTPTSTEIRKMITRRMSREMKEMDESNLSIEEIVTPKRRNARKNTDDNESVASEGSIASSFMSGESKPVRRGRKSVVATKPDLSVIPEILAEESKEQSALEFNEYSGARRLTRHQKSLMESSSSRGRRRSNTSRTSRSSLSEQDEQSSTFDLQPIDRISLLNKEAYEGPPDEDELRHLDMSPESIASDASKMRRSRMARAASEAKAVTPIKAAKIHKRIASVDIPGDSPIVSPATSGTDSPARSRRASFTRAVEALHTPKGRRTSTDSRKSDFGSPVESPPSETGAPLTPSRRPRRPSTQSNTSQMGRRSKKMPVLEEVKENK